MNIARVNIIRVCDCGRGFETGDKYNFHKQDCPIELYKQRVAEAIEKYLVCQCFQLQSNQPKCAKCVLKKELGIGTMKEVKK